MADSRIKKPRKSTRVRTGTSSGTYSVGTRPLPFYPEGTGDWNGAIVSPNLTEYRVIDGVPRPGPGRATSFSVVGKNAVRNHFFKKGFPPPFLRPAGRDRGQGELVARLARRLAT